MMTPRFYIKILYFYCYITTGVQPQHLGSGFGTLNLKFWSHVTPYGSCDHIQGPPTRFPKKTKKCHFFQKNTDFLGQNLFFRLFPYNQCKITVNYNTQACFKLTGSIFEVQNHQNHDFSLLTTRWRQRPKIFLRCFFSWSFQWIVQVSSLYDVFARKQKFPMKRLGTLGMGVICDVPMFLKKRLFSRLRNFRRY